MQWPAYHHLRLRQHRPQGDPELIRRCCTNQGPSVVTCCTVPALSVYHCGEAGSEPAPVPAASAPLNACASGPVFQRLRQDLRQGRRCSSGSSPRRSCTAWIRPISLAYLPARPTIPTRSIQLELDEAQAHLDELAQTYGERAISLPEWLAARAPIEARLAAAKKQLARLSRVTVPDPYIGNVPALRETWPFLR